MSSKLKWIAIAIVVVILILFVLPFLIPVNKFRPTIEEKASAALGRKVEVGNLSLSIIRGSLGIDNLSISDDPKFNSGPFLTASSVRVGVELLPLIFSKQVNVTEIVIDKPQVMMLKDPSGKWNFSSIGGKRARGTQAASPSSRAKEGGAQCIGQQCSGVFVHRETGTEGRPDHHRQHQFAETQRVCTGESDSQRCFDDDPVSTGLLDGAARRRHDED